MLEMTYGLLQGDLMIYFLGERWFCLPTLELNEMFKIELNKYLHISHVLDRIAALGV